MAFDYPDQGKPSNQKLLKLRQGQDLAAEYAVCFHILVAECGLNDPALITVFHNILNSKLQTKLACSGAALHLQNERFAPAVTPALLHAYSPPLSLLKNSHQNHAVRDCAEKERRCARGLCLYCGGSGHFMSACPVRPQKESSPHQSLEVESNSYLGPTLFVLLDSRLAGNFVSSYVVSFLSIPVFTLASSVSVSALDGRPVGSSPVTQIIEMILYNSQYLPTTQSQYNFMFFLVPIPP